MTRSKTLKLGIIAVALLYTAVEAYGTGDLLIFLSAAHDLGSADIYVKSYFDGYHYYYSLLFAWLLKPLWTLPYYGLRFCWILLSIFLYADLFRLLANSSFVGMLQPRARSLYLLLVFAFSLRFLHENLHTTQVTIIMLWCCVSGIRWSLSGYPLRGGAALAAGISLKILPVVFVPYLLYRARYRALASVFVFYLALMVVPVLFLDIGYYLTLMKSWWQLINPSNTRHVLDVAERSFHGLSTLLSTLLVKNVPDVYALSLRRNVADISLDTLSAVLLAVRAALVALSLYFFRWPPFRPARSQAQTVIECAYLLLLVPLIFPHQQHYAFLFAVPAFAVCLYYTIARWGNAGFPRAAWTIALSFVYLSANLKLLLGEFNSYYEHYKILTYGALVLIPLLGLVRAGCSRHNIAAFK